MEDGGRGGCDIGGGGGGGGLWGVHPAAICCLLAPCCEAGVRVVAPRGRADVAMRVGSGGGSMRFVQPSGASRLPCSAAGAAVAAVRGGGDGDGMRDAGCACLCSCAATLPSCEAGVRGWWPGAGGRMWRSGRRERHYIHVQACSAALPSCGGCAEGGGGEGEVGAAVDGDNCGDRQGWGRVGAVCGRA